MDDFLEAIAAIIDARLQRLDDVRMTASDLQRFWLRPATLLPYRSVSPTIEEHPQGDWRGGS